MTKILTNDEINQFKKDGAIFLKGKFETSFFIWQFINTEIWFQIFIDKKGRNLSKTFKFNS